MHTCLLRASWGIRPPFLFFSFLFFASWRIALGPAHAALRIPQVSSGMSATLWSLELRDGEATALIDKKGLVNLISIMLVHSLCRLHKSVKLDDECGRPSRKLED